MQPDVVTYNSLMSACEKGKDPDRALKVIASMGYQCVQPDVITFSSLISTCEKGKNPERALEVNDRATICV